MAIDYSCFLFMHSSPQTRAPTHPVRLAWLDLLRGLAALAVMLGHTRGVVLQDFGTTGGEAGLLARAAYFATGLGHQAVVIFFAMSGFLVGGSTTKQVQSGRFCWRRYSAARLSRLWAVLIPVLLMTLLLDKLGAAISPESYRGSLHSNYSSGPSGQLQDSALVLVGNLIFLQEIEVPTFGSNGPLWSLSYEFWFYVLGPLLIAGVASPGIALACRSNVVRLIAVAGLAAWLPGSITTSFLIWLAGAASAQLVGPLGSRPPWAIATGAALMTTMVAASLVGSKMGWSIGEDGFLGILTAALLPFLAALQNPPKPIAQPAFALSEISYSMYLVHFPILFFIGATVLKGKQYPSSFGGWSTFMILSSFLALLSAAFWWLFERKTPRFRRSLESLLDGKQTAPAK